MPPSAIFSYPASPHVYPIGLCVTGCPMYTHFTGLHNPRRFLQSLLCPALAQSVHSPQPTMLCATRGRAFAISRPRKKPAWPSASHPVQLKGDIAAIVSTYDVAGIGRMHRPPRPPRNSSTEPHLSPHNRQRSSRVPDVSSIATSTVLFVVLAIRPVHESQWRTSCFSRQSGGCTSSMEWFCWQ